MNHAQAKGTTPSQAPTPTERTPEERAARLNEALRLWPSLLEALQELKRRGEAEIAAERRAAEQATERPQRGP